MESHSGADTSFSPAHLAGAHTPGAGPFLPRLTNLPMIESLTGREREVLQLLGGGYSNREIAHKISVTEDTVKFHCKNIYGKLGASRRTHAVAIACGGGLLPQL